LVTALAESPSKMGSAASAGVNGADQKANAKSHGEAQDQRIKIEHLLRFAKGGRSTAD
jgi:hypothetical protein